MLLVSPLLFFKNSLSLSLIFLKKSFWQNSQSYEAMTLNRSHLLWSPETTCRACLIPSLGRHLRVGGRTLPGIVLSAGGAGTANRRAVLEESQTLPPVM